MIKLLSNPWNQPRHNPTSLNDRALLPNHRLKTTCTTHHANRSLSVGQRMKFPTSPLIIMKVLALDTVMSMPETVYVKSQGKPLPYVVSVLSTMEPNNSPPLDF